MSDKFLQKYTGKSGDKSNGSDATEETRECLRPWGVRLAAWPR